MFYPATAYCSGWLMLVIERTMWQLVITCQGEISRARIHGPVYSLPMEWRPAHGTRLNLLWAIRRLLYWPVLSELWQVKIQRDVGYMDYSIHTSLLADHETSSMRPESALVTAYLIRSALKPIVRLPYIQCYCQEWYGIPFCRASWPVAKVVGLVQCVRLDACMIPEYWYHKPI